MGEKRHKIGLLVATLSDDYSRRLTVGAMEAAKKLDVNLVIFPGKYVGVQHINEHYEAEFEYQYNTLFQIAGEAKLDYLIAAVGTIAYAHPREYHRAFLDALGDTPILSVASVLEGYDCLQFDNDSGIKAAVDYLVAHGRKHIAMIAGDINNEEFLQRYESYRKALVANGVAFEEGYMIPCRLAYRCYDEVETLLDSHPEIDAILCATDLIAYDVYTVLGRRGLRVGIDVAVVGYDDLPASARMDPPLASIRADAMQLGFRAVEKVVHHLNGVADDDQYMESQFIPRRSCYKYIDDFGVAEKILYSDFSTMVSHINDYCAQRCLSVTMDNETWQLIIGFLEHLYKYYVCQPVDESMVEETVAMLERIKVFKGDLGIARILHATYLWMVRNCPANNIPYVEMMQRRYSDEKTEETVESVKQGVRDRAHLNNVFIRDTLMFGGKVRDNYARIMKKLDSVGAVTAFLYTFPQPIHHSYGEAFPRDLTWSFKAYSYGNNVFTPSREEQRIATPQVFNNDHLCVNRQHIMVVADLFSAETQYGVALLEPLNEDFLDELELVTYQLSSAVRTLEIMRRQEELLHEQHSINQVLDQMAKMDELTGVYNRKGFYQAADAMINAPEADGKTFVICYADMDNLKVVNDTYGHAEGDFALKLVGACLTEMLGEGAVIGRIGGDEFAAMAPLAAGASMEAMMARKEAFINRFNASGQKPYPFGLSVGMQASACATIYDVRAALSQADDLLYQEKRAKGQGRT